MKNQPDLTGSMFLAALGILAGLDAGVVRAQEILNERCLWHRYYCFGPSRVSAAELKGAGARVLGARRLSVLRQDSQQFMAAHGIKASSDWRDHAVFVYRGPRSFNPPLTPPPPRDWAKPQFDDGAWARLDHPFQGSTALRLTNMAFGQFDESVDMMLLAAFYRTRFVVEDPAAAGTLTVRLAYAGGARVLVNGQEIARGHLPAGNLSPESCGDDYPTSAYTVTQRYKFGGPGKHATSGTTAPPDRILGPVAVPARALVKGVNILALEIRASAYHPVALTAPRQPNWNGPQRPFPHVRLAKVALSAGGRGVPSALRRPAGLQVWLDDPHHRMLSTTFPPPGEPAGTVRFVGARNGSYSAQVAIGADRPLAGLQVRAGELAQSGGAGRLPAGALQVLYTVPYPLNDWTLQKLGDERGVGASFPSNAELSRLAGFGGKGPLFFDRLTAAAPATIPANGSYPVRLLLNLPADTPAGRYQGALEVSARAVAPVKLPVEAEVIDWNLPDPKNFQTLVGCEQNPYAVARQYGVPLWSDRHFKLLEASFRQLGRIGNTWLNVPVLARTEFGNGGDSPIRWLRKGGGLDFDFTVLDKYLDLAVKHCGKPRVVQFVVMHNMKSRLTPMPPPQVPISGRLQPMWANSPAGKAAWSAFATALVAHMKARGLEKAMYWGAPEEQEYDPDLKVVLAAAAPGVFWTAGPHQSRRGGGMSGDQKYYQVVVDIRCMGGFRTNQGWKSSNPMVPLNPRVGGNVFALHTTSHPFAFRAMPGRALAMGRNGFARVGADEWAATHYNDMAIPRYMVGRGTLFLFWPGKDGAESSARFEALREGIQDTEARIFLEQALDRGKVPANLAAKVKQVLADDFRDTGFFQGNSVIYSLEENHSGWQDRSRKLFQAAAEVAKRGRGAAP